MAKNTNIWEGKTVLKTRYLSRAELAREGWNVHDKVTAIEFTDGSLLYAACDPEGNGPGALFGTLSDGQTVWVSPK